MTCLHAWLVVSDARRSKSTRPVYAVARAIREFTLHNKNVLLFFSKSICFSTPYRCPCHMLHSRLSWRQKLLRHATFAKLYIARGQRVSTNLRLQLRSFFGYVLATLVRCVQRQ